MAVLLTFVTAFAFAAVGFRLGLQLAPELPQGAAAERMKATVYPGTVLNSVRDSDGIFYDSDGLAERPTTKVLLSGHATDFRYSSLAFGPGAVRGDYRAWTTDLVQRLTADGWRVDAVEADGGTVIASGEFDQYGTRVQAVRDGFAMTVGADTHVVDIPAGTFYTTATITRQLGWTPTVLAIAAALLGVLVGWLVTGWVSRRTETASHRIGSLTREPAVVALVLLVPQALSGTVSFVLDTWRPQDSSQPFYAMSVSWLYRPALLGGALLLLSIAAAAVAARASKQSVLTTIG